MVAVYEWFMGGLFMVVYEWFLVVYSRFIGLFAPKVPVHRHNKFVLRAHRALWAGLLLWTIFLGGLRPPDPPK